jgi:hypothetical protein
MFSWKSNYFLNQILWLKNLKTILNNCFMGYTLKNIYNKKW